MTSSQPWPALCRPAAGEDDELWSVFHENSKVGREHLGLPDEAVAERMRALWESLPYAAFPAVPLPEPLAPLTAPVGEVMLGRTSVRAFAPRPVEFHDLARVLHHSYGVTRTAEVTGGLRGFRAVPSGGGLYPLELYVAANEVSGLGPGLYHFNPALGELRLLRDEDVGGEVAACMLQRDVVREAAVVVLLAGFFDRVTFKYGDRGYRFTLLEAGHVAQNLNLAAEACGWGALNLGGCYDREVDDLIGLDGVSASAVYAVALGFPQEDATAPGAVR